MLNLTSSNITVNSVSEWEYYTRITRIVLYTLVCVIGLVGNSIVVFLAVRANKRRSTTEVLIINLAISDLLVIVMFLPFDMVYVDIMHWVWPFGNLMCKIVNTLTDLSVIVSGTTLIFISFDRCRLIVNPMSQPFRTKTKAFILVVIWTYSVLLLLPFMLSLKVFPNGECLTDFSNWQKQIYVQLSYVFLIILPQCGLPLVCICFCYIKIGYYLRIYHKQFKSMMGETSVRSLRDMVAYRAKQKAKTLKVLTGLVIGFSITVIPHQIVLLMAVFDKSYREMESVRHLHEFTRLLMTTNSCINPILYGGLSKKFKRKVWELLTGKCTMKETEELMSRTSSVKTSRSFRIISVKNKRQSFNKANNFVLRPIQRHTVR